jgi:hypothetical protein
MGVPTSEVGYTSATTVRGDHEVHKGHVALGEKKKYYVYNKGLVQECDKEEKLEIIVADATSCLKRRLKRYV